MCIHVYICVNIHIDEVCMFICRFDDFEGKGLGAHYSTPLQVTNCNTLQYTPSQCNTLRSAPPSIHAHTQTVFHTPRHDWWSTHTPTHMTQTDRQTEIRRTSSSKSSVRRRREVSACSAPALSSTRLQYVCVRSMKQPYIVTQFLYIQIHNLWYIYRLSLIYSHVFAFTCKFIMSYVCHNSSIVCHNSSISVPWRIHYLCAESTKSKATLKRLDADASTSSRPAVITPCHIV